MSFLPRLLILNLAAKARRHGTEGMWFSYVMVILLSVIFPTPSQAWVPCFREFVGVNQSGTANLLFSNTVSFNRNDLDWGGVAPSSTAWQSNVLTNYGQAILACQAQNVQFLPILDYMTDWAADKSARSWTNGATVYSVVPTNNNNMQFYTYVNGVLSSQSLLTDFSKFPPADVNTFSNFAYRAASFLHAPPYNVKYFQVWNEAYWNNGYWYDSMNNYIKKIVIPSAQAIHAAGGKVVYGGWPDVAMPSSLLYLLDANRAWDSIDVLDMHYFNGGDVQTLRSGANSRGYTNIAIWQTEVGFTSDFTYSANYFPRLLFWNLTNDWTQDKYRSFYFANYAPNDSKAYGYKDCLWSGSALNGSGIVLTNLANVLGGTNQLSQYSGVTSSPPLTAQIWPGMSSIEAFSYSTNIAIVVHLTTADAATNPTVTLYLPTALTNIGSAYRVDLSGARNNVTSQLAAQGAGTRITLSTADSVGSLAQTWNGTASCFYLLINTSSNGLVKPTNLALYAPVVASSIQDANYLASNAVDGNGSTRWASLSYVDPQSIYVDLGAKFNISRVKLNWEAAYGKSYQLQLSSDAVGWTNIFSTTNGAGGVEDLTGLSGTGRYVRMYGTVRGSIYGYSLYEFEVYGTLFVPPVTGLSATGGNGQVSLNWTASPGATSYNVKRAVVSGGSYATLANVTSTSFVDTTGIAGATYFYVVSALLSQAESQDSAPVSASSAPISLGVAQINNLLCLSWPAYGNFALWSSSNLIPPVAWSPVTNAVQGTNVRRVTITPLSQAQFYQLRSQ